MFTYDELAAMSDDDIIAFINDQAQHVGTPFVLLFDELHRRASQRVAEATQRAAETTEALARSTETLTRRVLWFTAANVVVAVVAAAAALAALVS